MDEKMCPECYSVLEIEEAECDNCGYEFVTDEWDDDGDWVHDTDMGAR